LLIESKEEWSATEPLRLAYQSENLEVWTVEEASFLVENRHAQSLQEVFYFQFSISLMTCHDQD